MHVPMDSTEFRNFENALGASLLVCVFLWFKFGLDTVASTTLLKRLNERLIPFVLGIMGSAIVCIPMTALRSSPAFRPEILYNHCANWSTAIVALAVSYRLAENLKLSAHLLLWFARFVVLLNAVMFSYYVSLWRS